MTCKLIFVFFCLALNFVHDQINGRVHVVFICLLGSYLCLVNIDDYYPLNEDLVRVPYIKGFWELIKIDDSSTKIVFMSAASPGGSIPDWLADSFVLDMPYHSLNNFRYMLKNAN